VATDGRPAASPFRWTVLAGQSDSSCGVVGAARSSPSACVTRHSAPIPVVVVARVSSRRRSTVGRRRRRSRPRATRRVVARLRTAGGCPIELARSRTVASRSVTRNRTRRSAGLRSSRRTSSRKRSSATHLLWRASASPHADGSPAGALGPIVVRLDAASGRGVYVHTLRVSEPRDLEGMGTGLHRSRWPPPTTCEMHRGTHGAARRVHRSCDQR
jgi:hypothetical protein